MTPDARLRRLVEANRNAARLHNWNGLAGYGDSPAQFKRKAAEALISARILRDCGKPIAGKLARVAEYRKQAYDAITARR